MSDSRLIRARDFLRMPFNHFGFTGVKLFSWEPTDTMSNLDKVKFTFAVLNLAFNCCAMWSFAIFDEFENTLHFTAIVIYIGFSINGLCKTFSVWLGRHDLREVILEMQANTFPNNLTDQRAISLPGRLKRIERLMFYISGGHWVVVFMFNLFPISQTLIGYYRGNDSQELVYYFPYIMTYPFNEKQPLPYVFAYLTQLIAGVTISSYFVAAELLLVATVELLIIQFDALAARISSFQVRDPAADLLELKAVIKLHSLLLNFTERVNNIFNISSLLNYMIMILVTCVVGFQIAAGSDFLDLTKFVGFQISSLSHIYSVCYFSQELLRSSEEISKAFHGQPWYDADVRYQRMMLLAVARAQRPAHLTAYKFFIISMESFGTLMTTSYQFFTLIKSRYDESNN